MFLHPRDRHPRVARLAALRRWADGPWGGEPSGPEVSTLRAAPYIEAAPEEAHHGTSEADMSEGTDDPEVKWAEGLDPALTAEEWTRLQTPPDGHIEDGHCCAWVDGETVRLMSDENERTVVPSEQRHALAALCLYGQPFGFTREDVDDLRWAAKHLVHFGLKSIADRIEALLPPP